MKISIFWFRRDLRVEDNTALNAALNAGLPVLPIFIFDVNILEELTKDDPRVNFIYETLSSINNQFYKKESSLKILKGKPVSVFRKLIIKYKIAQVFFNKDYEPYSLIRDKDVKALLTDNGIKYTEYKDQVIFGEDDILKNDNTPYTVYTPYKRKWLEKFRKQTFSASPKSNSGIFVQKISPFPELSDLGFRPSSIKVKDYNLSNLNNYSLYRDIPGEDSTSYLGPHLRLGTVSIRQVILKLGVEDSLFLSELIWREFFMQILFHFPKVVNENFHSKYNQIEWLNDEKDFKSWCDGNTGYPLVDAGMRQLNQTGYMHNRVRMVTASFRCKHLLVDWRWGEAYFARKLLDYELASNNGNWQWAAGTGCDATPYFRVFNPTRQMKKFDKELKYVDMWVPEYVSDNYKARIVDHEFARKRAIETYKKGLQSKF